MTITEQLELLAKMKRLAVQINGHGKLIFLSAKMIKDTPGIDSVVNGRCEQLITSAEYVMMISAGISNDLGEII